jgi:hypothetical protein
MDDRTFVLGIKKQLRRIFVLVSVTFAVAALLTFLSNNGRATMRVKLLGSPVVRSQDNAAIYQNLFQSAELLEKQSVMIFSDEMVSHLVRKFNLYRYYGIDRNSEYASETIFRIITDRLTVEKKVMDILSISYKDKDRRMAVTILNELVAKLEEMNRNDIREHLRLNAEIYDASRQDLRESLEKAESRIKDKLNLLSQLEKSNAPLDEKTNAQVALFTLTSNLGKIKSDYYTANTNYLLTLSTIERDQRPIVHVVSKAMPEPSDIYYVSTGVGLVFAVIVLLISLAFIYYSEQYKWIYEILFSKQA